MGAGKTSCKFSFIVDDSLRGGLRKQRPVLDYYPSGSIRF